MTHPSDKLMQVADEFVQAGRRLQMAREQFRAASAEYEASHARFRKLERECAPAPVLTKDLPVIPIAERAAEAIKELG
jgi:hypothetical protein